MLSALRQELQEMQQDVIQALLGSPFRAELEEKLGKLLFTNLEIAQRSFDPVNMDLMAEENRLQSQYQKLYALSLIHI